MDNTIKIKNRILADNDLDLINSLAIPAIIIDSSLSIEWLSQNLSDSFSELSLKTPIKELYGFNDIESLDELFELHETGNCFNLTQIDSNTIPNAEYLITFNKPSSLTEEKTQIKNIAHDFNNILTSVLNSVALLKQKSNEPEKISSLIENIEGNANRAAEIITDVLTPDKHTSRKVSVKNLIKEVDKSVRFILPENISLFTSLQDDLKSIYGRYSDLYRVIYNLIMNSIEAIDTEGQIKIFASNKTLSNKQANLRLDYTDCIEIVIEDNGTGIKPEDILKIFDSTFSTKEKKRQSGLGLSIVREIIKSYNGEIIVESKLGIGTKFSIILPAFIQIEETAKQDKTVMVAEDETMLQELLAELLESYNYKVIKASNGNEVLKKISEMNSDPDLLIIDKKMPDMDGLSCIKKLREDKKNFPIVLASGVQVDDLEIQAKDLDVNYILQKPYNFEILLEIVRDTFN